MNAYVETKREKYENGLVVVSNETTDTETVAISGSIRAGAIFDEEGKFGAAELTSKLLTRGTKAHTAGEVSQIIEEAGATLQFTNRDESVSFSGRCYQGALGDLFGVIRECLMDPVFPEEEVERARAEIISEIKSDQDDTRATSYKRLMQLLYGKNEPYGRDPLGREDDLEQLTRQDLKLFHEKNYSPSGMVLAVTGKYSFGDLKTLIERLFSGWPREDSSGRAYSEPDPFGAQIFLEEMGHKSQVDLALGAKAVPRESSSFYPLTLGNLVLGRMGLYGRLGKNVRDEKGLAYYCFSSLQAKLYSGNIGIYAGVNPKNIEKAIEGVAQEILRISSEVISEKEIETAKKNLVGALSVSLDTSFERVNLLHDIEYYNLGLDYIERYPAILSGINSSAVLREFQRYLDPDKISLAASGPIGGTKLRLPRDLLRAV